MYLQKNNSMTKFLLISWEDSCFRVFCLSTWRHALETGKGNDKKHLKTDKIKRWHWKILTYSKALPLPTSTNCDSYQSLCHSLPTDLPWAACNISDAVYRKFKEIIVGNCLQNITKWKENKKYFPPFPDMI